MVYVWLDETKKLHYARHAVIDELQLDKLPQDRNPAARLLANDPIGANARSQLLDEIAELQVTSDRWVDNKLLQVHIPQVAHNEEVGFILNYDIELCRCKISNVIPGSTLQCHLRGPTGNNVIGMYVLEVNGIRVRTVSDITQAISTQTRLANGLSGINFLMGKRSRADQLPSLLEFSPADAATTRSVWSINHVASITGQYDPVHKCPRHWHLAMKGPFKKQWLQGLFKHLNNCHNIGTYGLPAFPPPGVTVIDAVLAIMHKLDSAGWLLEHKVRCCVNGSQQVQGLDYDESYAATILAMSCRILIALCCGLPPSYGAYHFDISNAFQSTPAKPNDDGNRLWLRLFPEYIQWLQTNHPLLYDQLPDAVKHAPVKSLAVEMFNHVQGRCDASRIWEEYIEPFLKDPEHGLGLTSNRADSCIYSGSHNGDIIILGCATDDGLVITTPATYEWIVGKLEEKWTVHKKG